MKNLLKQKFLLFNYSKDLRSSFQDLKQGSMSVVEYSDEFMTMQARCGLNEDDDVLVDRYFYRLTLDIEHILIFKHFDNVDEIVQHAIKAEGIANDQARKLIASKWFVQKTPSKSDFNPNVTSLEKFFSNFEDQNKFMCFHCKQNCRRSFECPKRINLMEGAQVEPKTQHDSKSEASDEVEEITAETDGEILLVQQESYTHC